MTSARLRIGTAVAAASVLMATCAVGSAAQGATPTPGVGGAGTGASDYVVVLDPGSSAADARAVAAGALAAGGTIRRTYSRALIGFSATLPTGALAAVRATAGVAYVEPDAVATIDQPEMLESGGTQKNAIWGLDRIDQRNLPLDNTYRWQKSGAGVTVYMIDSGIRFTHEEFEGRARSGPDFYDDDDDSSDCGGHGTHGAGTIGGRTYGVAKEVSLVAIRVIGCVGQVVLSDVLAAIDWVIDNDEGRSVISLTLQFPPDQALDDAVAAAFAEDILVATAANGSDDDACTRSPGREPTGVTAAASTIVDEAAWFSSSGSCVDLFAPGANIRSAGVGSDTAWVVYSGTSMSASHVAGGIALLLEKKPRASALQITRTLLRKSSWDKIINPGPGTPNRLLFTRKF